MLLGLKADGHNAAKTLRECQLAESANWLFALERGDGIVIAQIAKSEKAAEPRHEPDEIIIEPLFLRGAAEIIA